MNKRKFNPEKGTWETVNTTYIDAVFWNLLPSKLEELDQAVTVIVAGELDSDSWEKDGKKKHKIYISGSELEIVKKREKREEEKTEEKAEKKEKKKKEKKEEKKDSKKTSKKSKKEGKLPLSSPFLLSLAIFS